MTKIVRFAQLSKNPLDAAQQATTDGSSKACAIDASLQGGVVSIGNFDGVHLGHAALLGELCRRAKSLSCPTIAVIFDPHPAVILRPGLVPPRLTWIERRAELLSQVGVDYLLVIETTREFLNLSAAKFFQSLIVDQLKAKAIVEGPNFFFGRGRSGNVDTLRALCDASNIEFAIAQPTKIGGEMISSTRIRELLESGHVEQAAKLLGEPHRIRGRVSVGEQRGRQIGFPTANLTNIDVVAPGPGVYGGYAWIQGDRFDAAIHIGPNPTFDNDAACKIEIHVLDFSGDLYDTILMVDFVTAVREIARFNSADQLTQQLTRDVATIRSRLDQIRNSDAGDSSDQKGN